MKAKILRYIYTHDIIIRNKFKNYNNLMNNQSGGSKFEVSHNDNIYIFKKLTYDNIYVLYSHDKLKNDFISITVDDENNVANINNINGDINNCIISGNKVCSNLLQLSINFLKKYAEKLNIKLITLTDNSYKKCNNKNIQLNFLSTLTYGETWYGKYGFILVYYDGQNFLQDNGNIKIYNKNKELMEYIKISNIDKILLSYFKKLDNFSKDQYSIIKKLIKEKPDMLVKDFLKKFLKNYDSTCIYFEQFYKDLYYKIGLQNTTNLYGLFL